MSNGTDDRNGDKPGYPVGYGSPPVETQFKPGKSGNPRGRPRGSKNRPRASDLEPLKSILTEEAYRPVKVRDGERIVTIPVMQAIVRTVSMSALKGNHRSQNLLLQALSLKEKEDSDRRYNSIEAALDYKKYWEAELEKRETLGARGPEPVPHPDHVVIDFALERVVIKGPMTKEEKVIWDDLKQVLQDQRENIRYLERRAHGNHNDNFFAEELMKEKRRYENVMNRIPESHRHLVDEE